MQLITPPVPNFAALCLGQVELSGCTRLDLVKNIPGLATPNDWFLTKPYILNYQLEYVLVVQLHYDKIAMKNHGQKKGSP